MHMSDWKKELRELVELKEMGAITQAQFEAKRDSIIAKSESKEPHGSEPSISIDSTIGNYQILSLIGEGGMGKVYLGRHKEAAFAKAQGAVAIKIMHPQLANDENFTIQQVNSPNSTTPWTMDGASVNVMVGADMHTMTINELSARQGNTVLPVTGTLTFDLVD